MEIILPPSPSHFVLRAYGEYIEGVFPSLEKTLHAIQQDPRYSGAREFLDIQEWRNTERVARYAGDGKLCEP